MNDSVDNAQARRLAQIEYLYKEMLEQETGRARCPHCFGDPPPRDMNHAQRSKSEQLALAVYFVKWPDEHTFAEHERRRRYAMLAACPTYDPPRTATYFTIEPVN
jgi:hypothetical protein